MLDKIISKIPKLKLIVIDTFSEHLRATDVGYNDRKKMIAEAENKKAFFKEFE